MAVGFIFVLLITYYTLQTYLPASRPSSIRATTIHRWIVLLVPRSVNTSRYERHRGQGVDDTSGEQTSRSPLSASCGVLVAVRLTNYFWSFLFFLFTFLLIHGAILLRCPSLTPCRVSPRLATIDYIHLSYGNVYRYVSQSVSELSTRRSRRYVGANKAESFHLTPDPGASDGGASFVGARAAAATGSSFYLGT